MSGLQIIRRLLGFLRPFGMAVTLSIFSGFATVGASIGLMATAAYLISAAALHPSIAELQIAIVAVRFFGLSRGVFRYLERLLSHGVNLNLLARMRVWLYQRIEPLAPAGLLDRQGGDLLARLVTDVDTLENFYVRVVFPLAVAGLTGLGMGIFLGSYDLRLALILLCTLMLVGIGLPAFAGTWAKHPGQQLVEIRAQLGATLVDGLQGCADLLGFNQQGRYLESLERIDKTYASVQNQMAWIQATQAGLSTLLSNLGAWGVLVLAIPLVRSGHLVGVVLASLVLASLASFEAVLPLPLAFQYLGASLQSARRLFTIADQIPLVQDPPDPIGLPSSPDLQIRQLRFAYPGTTQPALEGIDLDMPIGKRVAIVGPSGAGKSTLVNLLLRFWEPYEGDICLGGIEVRKLSMEVVRSRFAVIAQNTTLFNASVSQNLRIAKPGASDEILYAAARQAQIHDFLASLPQGYDTQIGERGLRFSAGERQRLAIARALLQDAPILILDEPTANLDAKTSRELMQTLHQAVFPGRSVLLITHDLRGLEEMDEILVLAHGRVIERHFPTKEHEEKLS